MIPEIIKRKIVACFEDEQLKNIAGTIIRQDEQQSDNLMDAMISALDDAQCRNMITKLAMTESRWDRDGCERLLSQFQARHQRRAHEELRRQIQAAEKEKNYELLDRLLRQKQQQAGKGLIPL
jgi:LPS O-antigen subunit length determinant protein (WzzB/FepE family)